MPDDVEGVRIHGLDSYGVRYIQATPLRMPQTLQTANRLGCGFAFFLSEKMWRRQKGKYRDINDDIFL
jgi:hypothetical protein